MDDPFRKVTSGMETFESELKGISLDKEVEVLVRDIETYEWISVLAVLQEAPQGEEFQPLWVRDNMGRLKELPMGIFCKKKLD